MTTYTQAEREKMITELTVAAGLLSVGQVRDFDDLSETLACAANMLAAPSTGAEPIYQYQLANGGWIDQTKEIYDHLIKRGGATVRAVYLSAPSTSQDMKALNESGELMEAAVEMRTAMDALKAENNRFRAALTIIGNWGGTTRFYGSGSYTDVARAALGKGAQ